MAWLAEEVSSCKKELMLSFSENIIMDEMYGLLQTNNDYTDKVLMSPDNLMFPADYQTFYSSSYGADHHRIPYFGSEELMSAASAISEAASITPGVRRNHENHDDMSSFIKAKIASHPFYPKLLQAYIDCQKILSDTDLDVHLNLILAYIHVLGLCQDFIYLTGKLVETLLPVSACCLVWLCCSIPVLTGYEGAVSSDEDFSGGEMEGHEAEMRGEDRELKDRLLRKYGNHIGSLKREFSKKKKKGKLPKEARHTLLEWWNLHYRWPYPTEADKILLAESTGLDQKQINNWFINQRKRHWKPSENMQLAVMDNLSSGQFFTDD
ncbi:hypothetical protein TEA_023731 [Camellia sinensis var. sinensis]|uniref:Homeobox protein knotted-1-like 6 n=1 Tax=Camellia sinensis var. sinensis TaxID=542762 RepID=A0A4S4DUU9_CAMSN|nr:hypothetical protein TEA_023731 [Camellia sinensis var. sinensis]